MRIDSNYALGIGQSFEVTNSSNIGEFTLANTDEFGKVVFFQNRAIFCEKDKTTLNEMIYFVGVNCIEDVSKILYIGDFTFDLDTNCDFIPTKFDTLSTNFENSNTLKNKISFDDLNSSSYDLIIIDNKLNESCYFESEFLTKIKSALKNGGVLICSNVDFSSNRELFKQNLATVSSKFRIAMPYIVKTATNALGNFIFASDRVHPTSDIILDKSDFLEECFYYTSEIHLNSFILPNYLKKELLNIAKN